MLSRFTTATYGQTAEADAFLANISVNDIVVVTQEARNRRIFATVTNVSTTARTLTATIIGRADPEWIHYWWYSYN